MAKQTFTTGQVLTAAQMTSLQQTAMGGGSTTAKTTSYVLVAADAGTVVQMNSASATTITVNTALFAAGDTVQIQNIGAGICTITAGTATVSTAGSLALSQYEGGQLYFNTTSAALFFDIVQSSAANPSYSLINSGGTALTAASTITVSGISGMNALKILVIDASTVAASSALSFRFNGDTGANYDFAGPQFSAPVTYAASQFSNFSTTGFTRIESGTMSNNATSAIGAYCEMTGCNSTGFKSFTYGGSATLGGGTVACQTTWGGGIYKGTSTISSVTVFNTAGSNFDGGTIYIYGSA